MIGDRFYIEATATLINSDGKVTQSKAYAREQLTRKGMDESQVTGSASSYARKYCLNGLFLIDDTKDADTQKPIETNDQLEQALKEAENCTNKEQAGKIWTKYSQFQSNEDFKNAFSNVK
jgi:hypothetical protein